MYVTWIWAMYQTWFTCLRAKNSWAGEVAGMCAIYKSCGVDLFDAWTILRSSLQRDWWKLCDVLSENSDSFLEGNVTHSYSTEGCAVTKFSTLSDFDWQVGAELTRGGRIPVNFCERASKIVLISALKINMDFVWGTLSCKGGLIEKFLSSEFLLCASFASKGLVSHDKYWRAAQTVRGTKAEPGTTVVSQVPSGGGSGWADLWAGTRGSFNW